MYTDITIFDKVYFEKYYGKHFISAQLMYNIHQHCLDAYDTDEYTYKKVTYEQLNEEYKRGIDGFINMMKRIVPDFKLDKESLKYLEINCKDRIFYGVY